MTSKKWYMRDPCLIGLEFPNLSIKHVLCDYSTHISQMAPLLLNHWKDPQRIHQMLCMGNMKYPGTDIQTHPINGGCEFWIKHYGMDWENHCAKHSCNRDSISIFGNYDCTARIYLYDMQANEWLISTQPDPHREYRSLVQVFLECG